MIRTFGNCREQFRREYIENIVSRVPNIHFVFGAAVHKAVELFWHRREYSEAIGAAQQIMEIDETCLLDRKQWGYMKTTLPQVVECYYRTSSWEPQELIEQEWKWPYMDCWCRHPEEFHDDSDERVCAVSFYKRDTQCSCAGMRPVYLCGKIDRFSQKRQLVDLKTTGFPKGNFPAEQARNIAIQLYDWYLCQRAKKPGPHFGREPVSILIEPLVKPKGNPETASYRPPYLEEPIELNNLIAPLFRKRTEQQIRWYVGEIVNYMRHEAETKPWLMNDGQICVNKYNSTCPYLPLCNQGDIPNNLKLYVPREEHLEIRKSQSRALKK